MDSEIIQLREKQSLLLMMLQYVREICEENNIQFVMIYGSALGAKRHGGFIPWDDDLDIGVLYYDYNRLIQALNANVNTRYEVISYSDSTSYLHPYAKVVDTKTHVIEPGNKEVRNLGVFIDIFPHYRLNKNNLISRIRVLKFNILQKIYCQKFVRKPVKFETGLLNKCLEYNISLLLLHYVDNPKEYLDWLHKKFISKCSKYGAYICSPYDCNNIWPYELFFPLKEEMFLGESFPVPGEIDQYLISVYGLDYMTPKRTLHSNHGRSVWNNE